MIRWNNDPWTTPYKFWFVMAVCLGCLLGILLSGLWMGEMNDRAIANPCGMCKIVPVEDGR